MLLSIIVLILSCFVQGMISNYLGYTYLDLSIFSTIYILIALLVIKPYFENEQKYFILLIIFGLLMDIVYTNTFILNTCLFIVIYYFTKFFHFFFPYNYMTINISNLLSIFIYHIITFLFLWLLRYDHYSLGMLLKILTHSIIMTLFYTSLVYEVVYLIQKKFQLKVVK